MDTAISEQWFCFGVHMLGQSQNLIRVPTFTVKAGNTSLALTVHVESMCEKMPWDGGRCIMKADWLDKGRG